MTISRTAANPIKRSVFESALRPSAWRHAPRGARRTCPSRLIPAARPRLNWKAVVAIRWTFCTARAVHRPRRTLERRRARQAHWLAAGIQQILRSVGRGWPWPDALRRSALRAQAHPAVQQPRRLFERVHAMRHHNGAHTVILRVSPAAPDSGPRQRSPCSCCRSAPPARPATAPARARLGNRIQQFPHTHPSRHILMLSPAELALLWQWFHPAQNNDFSGSHSASL